MRGAVEPDGRGLLGLEAAALALGGVAGDQLVLEGDVEDLPETGDRLVDRGRGEGAASLAVLAPPRVGVLEGHRFALGGGGADLLGFGDLGLAIAVYLGDRDLREAMLAEEGEEVAGELPFVVKAGTFPPFALGGVEPFGGEVVEGGVPVDLRGRWGLGDGRLPGASLDVGHRVPELLLGFLAAPAFLRGPERDVLAGAVGAESQRPHTARSLDGLACGLTWHPYLLLRRGTRSGTWPRVQGTRG
ncbi:MAG TPA: hypothetical protein VGX16_04500 [Solirubrobacteraceae bacterium]|nr:hypothetical protein [Solirubrobacteraceae bacterium]